MSLKAVHICFILLATALTIAPPLFLILTSGEGAYRMFWTLFGTSNQLLAALTLLGITVWLKKSGRPAWFTLLPMLFVMFMTAWSLLIQVRWAYQMAMGEGLALSTTTLNGIVSLALLFLAATLIVEALRSLSRPAAPALEAPTL